MSDPLRPAIGLTRDVPPSGHVIGQYASAVHRGGRAQGARELPAGVDPGRDGHGDDSVHGLLNSKG